MKFFIYVSLFLSLNLKAQEDKKSKRQFIWLKISRVEPYDFDTFLLTNFRGNHLELTCSDNAFLGNKHSYIKYTNIYGIHVKDFLFKDDYTCHIFKRFLNSTFPAVDERKTVKIQFNRSTGYVEKVLLPDLDELENGGIYYDEDEKEQFANI